MAETHLLSHHRGRSRVYRAIITNFKELLYKYDSYRSGNGIVIRVYR